MGVLPDGGFLQACATAGALSAQAGQRHSATGAAKDGVEKALLAGGAQHIGTGPCTASQALAGKREAVFAKRG